MRKLVASQDEAPGRIEHGAVRVMARLCVTAGRGSGRRVLAMGQAGLDPRRLVWLGGVPAGSGALRGEHGVPRGNDLAHLGHSGSIHRFARPFASGAPRRKSMAVLPVTLWFAVGWVGRAIAFLG